MSEQRAWGGARANAGRPALGDKRRVNTGFCIPPDLHKALVEYSEAHGITRSEALTRCLREWFKAKAEKKEALV